MFHFNEKTCCKKGMVNVDTLVGFCMCLPKLSTDKGQLVRRTHYFSTGKCQLMRTHQFFNIFIGDYFFAQNRKKKPSTVNSGSMPEQCENLRYFTSGIPYYSFPVIDIVPYLHRAIRRNQLLPKVGNKVHFPCECEKTEKSCPTNRKMSQNERELQPRASCSAVSWLELQAVPCPSCTNNNVGKFTLDFCSHPQI